MCNILKVFLTLKHKNLWKIILKLPQNTKKIEKLY